MTAPCSFRCRITGRVQGVFFRVATAEQANALGLDGSVRNLRDGSVEVVAAGQTDSIDQLLVWLWRGPPQAAVTAVSVEPGPDSVERGFRVLR
jgi:acylphosphatase